MAGCSSFDSFNINELIKMIKKIVDEFATLYDLRKKMDAGFYFLKINF
jgi:hypothetical protein